MEPFTGFHSEGKLLASPTNTGLAYHDSELITSVKSFMVQATGEKPITLNGNSPLVNNEPKTFFVEINNKLDRWPLANDPEVV